MEVRYIDLRTVSGDSGKDSGGGVGSGGGDGSGCSGSGVGGTAALAKKSNGFNGGILNNGSFSKTAATVGSVKKSDTSLRRQPANPKNSTDHLSASCGPSGPAADPLFAAPESVLSSQNPSPESVGQIDSPKSLEDYIRIESPCSAGDGQQQHVQQYTEVQQHQSLQQPPQLPHDKAGFEALEELIKAFLTKHGDK